MTITSFFRSFVFCLTLTSLVGSPLPRAYAISLPSSAQAPALPKSSHDKNDLMRPGLKARAPIPLAPPPHLMALYLQEKKTRAEQFAYSALLREDGQREFREYADEIADAVLAKQNQSKPEKPVSSSPSFSFRRLAETLFKKIKSPVVSVSISKKVMSGNEATINQARSVWKESQEELERLYNNHFADAGRSPDKSEFIQSACFYLQSEFRRKVGAPLKTALKSLQDDPECKDLIEDEPFLRYCLAVTDENLKAAEAIWALKDFATASNACLQSHQSRIAEKAFASAYESAFYKAEEFNRGDDFRNYFLPVTVNFFLTLYEANKHNENAASADPLPSARQILAANVSQIAGYESNGNSLFNQLGYWGYNRFTGGISKYMIALQDCPAAIANTGTGMAAPECESPQPCPGLSSFMDIALDPAQVGPGSLNETAGNNLPQPDPSTGCGGSSGGMGAPASFISCIGVATGGTTLTENLFCAPGGGFKGKGGLSDPVQRASTPGSSGGSSSSSGQDQGTSYGGVKAASQCNLTAALSGATKEGSENGCDTTEASCPNDQSNPDAEQKAKDAAASNIKLEDITDALENRIEIRSTSEDPEDQKKVAEWQQTLAKLKQDGEAAIDYATNAIGNASYTTYLGHGGEYDLDTGKIVVNAGLVSEGNYKEHVRVLSHEGVHAVLHYAGMTGDDAHHEITGDLGYGFKMCPPNSEACSCSALAEQIGNFNHCFNSPKGAEGSNPGEAPSDVCIVADGGGAEFSACGGGPTPPGQATIPGGGIDPMAFMACMGDLPTGDGGGNSSCWMVDCADAANPNLMGMGDDIATDVSGCCGGGSSGGAGGLDPHKLPGGYTDPTPMQGDPNSLITAPSDLEQTSLPPAMKGFDRRAVPPNP